jgi:hypothetical protein
VLISKYADHLPLYRQAGIYGRQGIELDRSTLAHWVGKAAHTLKPVFEALAENIKTSPKLFMDETPAPVLDPGRGRTKTGYMWVVSRDERPHSFENEVPENRGSPPAVACFYAPGRSGKYAQTFLEGFEGTLQVDGYAGYNLLTKDDRPGGPLKLAYCWAHARRPFVRILKHSISPVCDEALRRIGALYGIEKKIRGTSPANRLKIRQVEAVPLIEDMAVWLKTERAKVSRKSPLGNALTYLAKYWQGLTLFLEDGRVELDNNTVEREIRPLTLNRKNSLFAGHDQGGVTWGIIASFVGTCKLNNVNPQAWMEHALKTLVKNKEKNICMEDLMPWNFQKITKTE